MVAYPACRYHASEICDRSIVSECENAGCRELKRQQGCWPRFDRASGGPRLLPVARQTMDEDNTRRGKVSSSLLTSKAAGGRKTYSTVALSGL